MPSLQLQTYDTDSLEAKLKLLKAIYVVIESVTPWMDTPRYGYIEHHQKYGAHLIVAKLMR